MEYQIIQEQRLYTEEMERVKHKSLGTKVETQGFSPELSKSEYRRYSIENGVTNGRV